MKFTVKLRERVERFTYVDVEADNEEGAARKAEGIEQISLIWSDRTTAVEAIKADRARQLGRGPKEGHTNATKNQRQ